MHHAPAPAPSLFPFHRQPNTLDCMLVPAGWDPDSWGKIAVLRDGFDAKVWGEAWEHELDRDGHDGGACAKYIFLSLVGGDQGIKVHPSP